MKRFFTIPAYCLSLALVLFHWKLAKPFFVQNGLLLFQIPRSIGFVGFQRTQRKRTGYFLHITDMHIDEDYTEHGTFKSSCHKASSLSNSAGKWGSPGEKCDAPIRLAEKTLEWISKEWADKIDFVLWTGDNARHDWDKKNKRKRKVVYQSNQRMSDLMMDTFGEIPVIPSFGNNDVFPHNQMSGPGSDLLDFYTTLWHAWIPADQRSTFRQGGYFMTRISPQLYIISLNTMYFYNKNKAVHSCEHMNSPAFDQLVWFEQQLKQARANKAQVYVIGHVPPSSRDYKRTCLSQFIQLASTYTDVIGGHFFAHLNMDHFLIFDGKGQDLTVNRNIEAYTDWLYNMYKNIDTHTQTEPSAVVIQVSPSVLPVYYPTFRIYQYDQELLGYSQFYSNLTHWNQYDHLEYELEYTTKDQYQMPDLSVESYYKLAKSMVTDSDLWSLYREHMVIKTINFTDYDEDVELALLK